MTLYHRQPRFYCLMMAMHYLRQAIRPSHKPDCPYRVVAYGAVYYSDNIADAYQFALTTDPAEVAHGGIGLTTEFHNGTEWVAYRPHSWDDLTTT